MGQQGPSREQQCTSGTHSVAIVVHSKAEATSWNSFTLDRMWRTSQLKENFKMNYLQFMFWILKSFAKEYLSERLNILNNKISKVIDFFKKIILLWVLSVLFLVWLTKMNWWMYWVWFHFGVQADRYPSVRGTFSLVCLCFPDLTNCTDNSDNEAWKVITGIIFNGCHTALDFPSRFELNFHSTGHPRIAATPAKNVTLSGGGGRTRPLARPNFFISGFTVLVGAVLIGVGLVGVGFIGFVGAELDFPSGVELNFLSALDLSLIPIWSRFKPGLNPV